MKNHKSLCIILIMCLLCRLSVTSANANTQKTTESMTFDTEIKKLYFDAADIPDNILKLVNKHGKINEDFKIVKTEFSEKTQTQEDIYSLKLEKEDGLRIAEVYSTPIKYIDKNGAFQFIDTSLKISDKTGLSNGYEFCNASNIFTVEFSSSPTKGINMNDAFTIAIAENSSSIKTKGFADKTEQAAGKFIYENGFGKETTVEYINTETGIKENIIIKKNIGKNTFNFIFSSKTHIPILSDDKSFINIVDKNNYEKIDYVFSNLFIYDSFQSENQVYENNDLSFRHLSDDCYYELTQKDNCQYVISVVVPIEYLNNPNVVYPVTIDPTITVNSISSNIADTFVAQKSPNSNYGTYGYLRFGNTNSSGGRNYSFIWFRNLPAISSSYEIVNAKLNLTFRPGQTTSSNGAAYRVTKWWEEASITWNDCPTFETSPLDTSSHNNCSYYEFDITSIISDRYQGLSSNEGALISYSDLSYNDYNSVYSSEAASSGPKLTIYYKTPEVILPDGIYFFHNMGHYNDYYMDLFGDGTTNGTHVQQFQFGEYLSEQWQITHRGWGYYEIRSVLANDSYMLLDGRKSCVSGAQVIIHEKAPCPEQLWKIELTGDDGKSYRISPMRNAKLYLCVENPENGNNAKVKLEHLTSNYRQVWQLEPSGVFRNVARSPAPSSRPGNHQNCLGYVTFINQDLGRPNSTLDTNLENHLNKVAEFIETLPGISNCRRIDSFNSPIELNEYRIAYRTNSHSENNGFHFIIQLSNGSWAGKNDFMESKYFNYGNPSNSPKMWDNDIYPTTYGTHYFAISRDFEEM